MHDKSYDASLAVEAAGSQGQPKFWSMLDLMMTNQQAWASNPNYKDLWRQYAENIGLDVTKWQADMGAAKARVDLDLQRGRGMGVSSTPSIYVNNRLVPYKDLNVPTMKALIDSEAAGK
jgi:protein-disulfide isomerase